MPPEFYLPEEADLWCYNREMNDKVPDVPSEISYTEEILLLWLEGEMQPVEVVIPRSVWLDYNRLLTRTDYKPLNTNNNDPFDGKQGFVSQINDFGTGKYFVVYPRCAFISLNFNQSLRCVTISNYTIFIRLIIHH